MFFLLVVPLLQETDSQKICLGLTILQMGSKLMHPMWPTSPENQNPQKRLLQSRLSFIPRFFLARPTTLQPSLSPSNSRQANPSFTVTFFLPCGMNLNSIRRPASTGTKTSLPRKASQDTRRLPSSADSKSPISQPPKRSTNMALSSNYRAN